MFQDWKSKIKDNPQISPHLLWDIDKSKIDFDKMKKFIVQRVIERGDVDDFYAMFQLYGGPEGVREIVKKLPAFYDPRDEALARILFDLKKKDLECYKRLRLRKKRLGL
ncbi:MAG: hypothetical protein FWF13_05700 [Acidobacteria bacterium]|nr:hypothetical protein [Acidobacteriota bacterium]